MGSFIFKSTVEEEISHGSIAQNKAEFRDDTSQLKRDCNDKSILPDTDDDGEIQDNTTWETGKLQVLSGGNVSTENINGRRESNTGGGKSRFSTVAPPSRSGADEKDGSLEIHPGDQMFPAKISSDNNASVGLREITPTMEVAENANVLNVEAIETGQGPLESIAVADEITMGGDANPSRRETTSNSKIDRTDEEGNTPLYNAFVEGHLESVEYLISQGAIPNKPSNRERCPLQVVAEKGYGNIVNLLTNRGAEIQVECDIGNTPIHKAAAKGHTGIVESLIADGIDVNSKDQTGWTPFNAAVQYGHLETLKFLLSKGAKQNVHNGRTPLYAAAEFGQLEILQFLISEGADMKRENPSGRIPLHGAAISGDMEIIKYLIQKGSDVNKGALKGWTPLDAAIKYGHLDVVKYLMGKGTKLNRYDGMTPLYAAAKFGHLEIVKFFISEGADVNEENDSGEIPLHGAAFSSKMEVIKYLIQRGSEVNKADANGRTPFNAAIQYGQLGVVKYLLDKGAKQNACNGNNPLCAAAQFGHSDIVKFFISEGANVNEENDEGTIPLHGAASRGHISVMEYLLQQGSDCNKGRDKGWAPIHAAIACDQFEAVKYLLNYEGENSRCHTKNLLHTGAKFGHLDMMKFLTFKGADINEPDEYGAIPLHYASYGGHLKVMEYLIQLGSDVNKADLEGLTPFNAAIQYGHLEAVKYLLKEKAIQNRYDGMPPLHTAAQFGHLDIMEFLISKGADINETDEYGMIPLHHASYGGHLKVMEYLIQLGSDVSKADEMGWTPFNAAVQYGHLEAVKYLLKEKAIQNRYDGMTPLHTAAQFGHLDIMEFLISEGADINETDEDGAIPLHHATYGGQLKVMEYLIQQGSDVNKADLEGWTPLDDAIQYGHLEAVKYLLKEKAIQNKYDGMTPLHAAATVGHLDLVDFFISEGANVNEADVERMIPLHCAAARGHKGVIEYLIQHRSDINKRDKRGRMPHEVAIENGQLEVAKLLYNRPTNCCFEVMSSPNDHTDEGKLSVSSRWGVKESVGEMQSRAEQQAILPNNIANGKDDILTDTEKKRCDEMSSNVLFEKTHDSEDGSEERNSFLSAKLKSPDQREESPVQLWLESEKKDRVEKRNTVTNITNNLITSKYRTWKYEASNPPFLQEMKSNHGTGHPSEEPQSKPLPLTDETRETREPLSSWTLMNAGSNQLMRGTSANLISNLKNLPCLPNINTNLDNRNILSPSASASTIKCWYPSVLAATRCFLTTILALAVILAGSPVLVSGSEITQRIILQAGKPGVVPFQIPRAPNTTSKHVPYYTIRLKSQHRPFCINGAYDVMGLQSPTQLSRFSTSVSTCSNSFPCINLEIDNVNDKDEGIYIFTAMEYAIDHVWRETLEKEVMVEIPHGPAKCFIALSTDTPHPYEVHCRAYSGSMKTTLSCYQNNEKLVEKGISTDSVHVTRGVFFLPQHRLFSCCSHVITSEVSAVTCNDFQWRGKVSTTQSTNDIPTLVIKNITMSSNHGSTEDTPIHHMESSEGSGATVFHSVLPLVYLLIIMTKIIQ